MKKEQRLIDVQCSECRHVWQVDLSQVGRDAQVIYRGEQTAKVRLECPVCHKYQIVEVPQRWLS